MVADMPRVKTVTLNPSSLKNNTSDADRQRETLKVRLNTDAVQIPFEPLNCMPLLKPLHPLQGSHVYHSGNVGVDRGNRFERCGEQMTMKATRPI